MKEHYTLYSHGMVTLRGASANNLRISKLRIPLGRLVGAVGVDGGGIVNA